MIAALPGDGVPVAAAALLLELAVKGSILLLLGFLVTRCWRGSSAAVRHWVWVVVFGALLALPLLAIAPQGWHLPLPPPTHAVGSAPAPAARGGPASLSAELLGAADAVPPASAARERWRMRPGWALVVGWAAGAAGVLLLLAGAHLRRAVEVARGHSLRSVRALSVLRWLCGRMGITRLPRLVETASGSMPTTSGVLRLVIALPAGAADSWPDARLESVLLHELAHVRRRDLLVQLAAQVACALHWYNPLAWGALRQLRLESEMACDDLVVAAGVRASTYGELLVRLAREQRPPPLPALAWIPMAERSQLPTRLRALLDSSRRHGRASRRAVAGILAGGLALAGIVATAAGAVPASAASGMPRSLAADRAPDLAEGSLSAAGGGDGISSAETPWPPSPRPAGAAADTIPPALLNRGAVEEAIRRAYPPSLRERGVGGTAVLELEVDPAGAVAAVRLLDASNRAFGEAAAEALRAARFAPARTEDRPVAMRIQWPVAFNPLETGGSAVTEETAMVEAEIRRVMEVRRAQREAEVMRGTRGAGLASELMERRVEATRQQREGAEERTARAREGNLERLAEQRAELARQRAVATDSVREARTEAAALRMLAERHAELARERAVATDTMREARAEAEALRMLAEQQAELARQMAVETDPAREARANAAALRMLAEQHAELARQMAVETDPAREARANAAALRMLAEQQAELARQRAVETDTAREARADATALRMLTEQQPELVRQRTAAADAVRAAQEEAAARNLAEQQAELAGQRPGRVTGSVVDAAGTPIAGAVVTLGDRGARTDLEGRFAITGVPPGSSTLEVSVPGTGQVGSATIHINPGATATARVTVAPLGEI